MKGSEWDLQEESSAAGEVRLGQVPAGLSGGSCWQRGTKCIQHTQWQHNCLCNSKGFHGNQAYLRTWARDTQVKPYELGCHVRNRGILPMWDKWTWEYWECYYTCNPVKEDVGPVGTCGFFEATRSSYIRRKPLLLETRDWRTGQREVLSSPHSEIRYHSTLNTDNQP